MPESHLLQNIDLVILAGGKGTRIKELLGKYPKPMVKFNKKHFIQYLFNSTSKFNFKRIIILCGYRHKIFFEKYNKKLKNLTEIVCIRENKLLGTGGALSNLKKINVRDFVLVNGDTIFNLNLNSLISNLRKNKIGIIALTKNIKQCDLIILSDYNKGFLDRSLIKQIVAIAKKNDKLIVADPKKNDFSNYAGINILTPNQKEISNSANKNLNSEKKIINFSRYIMKKYNINEILVTRSSKGMLLIGKDYIEKILATSKNVKDVTGAGDTVIGVLALMKALGMNSIDASNVANIAAGITIEKLGTASLSYSELIK